MKYLKLIAILLLPLAFVVYYAYSPLQLPPPGWTLSKLKVPASLLASSPDTIAACDTTSNDSLPVLTRDDAEPDTSAQRILFFGDSMVEGLLRRMNGYAHANGYDVTNVVWYSSTTELWAKTDTLRHFLREVNPTFVMISLGGNEQLIKDASGCEPHIRQILKELGDIPFVWIGVPAWRNDSGINDLTLRLVGKERYFDSRGLTLQRGRDRMHPTFNAASLWMDTVARWMQSPQTAHPIRMTPPADRKRHTYRTYALQPMRLH